MKIDDELHANVRRASGAMCRSINAQAEYWIRIGMLAEANPALSFAQIMRMQLAAANVRLPELAPELAAA